MYYALCLGERQININENNVPISCSPKQTQEVNTATVVIYRQRKHEWPNPINYNIVVNGWSQAKTQIFVRCHIELSQCNFSTKERKEDRHRQSQTDRKIVYLLSSLLYVEMQRLVSLNKNSATCCSWAEMMLDYISRRCPWLGGPEGRTAALPLQGFKKMNPLRWAAGLPLR